MIPLLIRLLIFALVIGLLVYIVRLLMGSNRGQGKLGRLKCAGCRHFRGIEDDGVFCASGDFEKYKTFEDVDTCLDFARPG